MKYIRLLFRVLTAGAFTGLFGGKLADGIVSTVIKLMTVSKKEFGLQKLVTFFYCSVSKDILLTAKIKTAFALFAL